MLGALRTPAASSTLGLILSIQLASIRQWQIEMYTAPRLPVPVAFDTYVRIGGQEFKGTSYCRNALEEPPMGLSGICMFKRGTEVGDTCTVILRSSAEAACKSLDQYEYWEGELVFEDLPVSPYLSGPGSTGPPKSLPSQRRARR